MLPIEKMVSAMEVIAQAQTKMIQSGTELVQISTNGPSKEASARCRQLALSFDHIAEAWRKMAEATDEMLKDQL